MSEVADQWTVMRLIQWTRGYLARAGVDEPRLAGELLLADVLGCARIQLYTQHDRVVEPEYLAEFRETIHRAAGGEPIAYIRGFKEFYSLTFKVTPDVLIPRPETELLVSAALEFVRGVGGPVRLWDACTGSGCVAVAAAHYAPGLTALATDVCEPALAVAAENARLHGVADRVRLAQADLLALPEALEAEGEFDVMTANPPYVSDQQMQALPAPVLREPQLALRAGPTGLEVIERIVREAPARLRGGGLLAMEIGMGQADAVYQLLHAAGRYEDIRFPKDHAGIPRTAVARIKPQARGDR